MRESHQALHSFNTFSAKEFTRIGSELERKTKLVASLKKDLYNIFDRISMLRESIGGHFPEHEVILPEELEEEEDDTVSLFQAITTRTGDEDEASPAAVAEAQSVSPLDDSPHDAHKALPDEEESAEDSDLALTEEGEEDLLPVETHVVLDRPPSSPRGEGDELDGDIMDSPSLPDDLVQDNLPVQEDQDAVSVNSDEFEDE